MKSRDAYVLRETTGTSGVTETARAAVAVLADHDIPHLIAGGIAVQEYGYPRVTIDADIVVPDVLEAADWLTGDLGGPFRPVPKFRDRLEDRRNGVMVDLLPAGSVLKAGCRVPFPTPVKVSHRLQLVTIEQLISLKLDSAANSPLRRLRDKTDVVELIVRRKLARDLAVAHPVQSFFLEIWDQLKQEKP